ncbi:sel1 repeat family protein [Oligoflexus tunisiensis]|uniref:sel1 repeat family protein n=1 Tax=Oligoflexus tunisiensis TaxID=708132 RepID=UPI00114D028A|nr:sel1 repeat family protein [Oligoflexus tunisiensis]
MKAFWFGVIAVMLNTSACEKRKGTLLPPRDAALKAQAAAQDPDRTKMRARAMPEGMMDEETGGQTPAPLNDLDTKDLQTVKQEALDRIKQNPSEKLSHPSPGKAAALYQRGRQLVAQGHYAEGREYYLVACQFGYLEGCHKFGWHEERLGNINNARQFYKTACEGGISKSCNNLGFRLEKLQRWDEALDFYARACLEKHGTGCDNLMRLRDQRLKIR